MADVNTSKQEGVSSQGERDTPKWKLKIWKTVQTGIYKSGVEALSLFKDEGGNFRFEARGYHFKIGGYAYDKLKFLFFGAVEEAHLALISVGDLGFTDRPKYKYVCGAIARKSRLSFCSGVDLFWARLNHFGDQAKDKILVPIGPGEDKDGNRLMFRFERCYNSSLNAGRFEYWILNGQADPNRICELNEILLVRIVDAPAPSNTKALLHLMDVLLELKIKKQSPAL